MNPWRTTRSRITAAVDQADFGSALIETALVLPVLFALTLFAVDYGYFYLVASNMVTSGRNSAVYSIQGFSGPGQQKIPSAGTNGSLADTAGVAGLAAGDMGGLANNTSQTKVEVCSKVLGTTAVMQGGNKIGYITNCGTYPSGTLSYAPDMDPESLNGMLLHRVDVVYTVPVPVSLHIFGFNLSPPSSFHWKVEMRAID